MTDLEIWLRACERVGKWKPFCADCTPSHRIGEWPPIGDSACAMAMSEEVVKNPILWLHVFHLVEGGTVLPLALASAVIAIPVEEKANAES